MAYEDTNCPCGGRKDRETMLCTACQEWLAEHPALKTWQDGTLIWNARRDAAIVLVTRARSRLRPQSRPVRPVALEGVA